MLTSNFISNKTSFKKEGKITNKTRKFITRSALKEIVKKLFRQKKYNPRWEYGNTEMYKLY